ncbi:hypothetical protein XO10_08315 [Marinitoga sp. 1135]|nr:hypothetical protein LN42_09000 [Marinitoga sp. 1137]NUU96265.1 hypothetical protein [Marinitoga sp. 1135]NUU98184.1 hypothetical protein [Marinitoga sp. 1138]
MKSIIYIINFLIKAPFHGCFNFLTSNFKKITIEPLYFLLDKYIHNVYNIIMDGKIDFFSTIWRVINEFGK